MAQQLNLFSPAVWSVTNLTHYIRDLIQSDYNLQDIWVQGEVSNLSRPRSGHLYFTIKDQECSLRCVMWRSAAMRQEFIPRDGDAVEVHGAISVYEAAGQYQLYAQTIRPAGEGALFQEFLRLKARLEAEGLFAPERKRPIPVQPRRIGLVTSSTGAALRDMLNTLRRRYALVEVFLAPTEVQGDAAPAGIVAALEVLNRRVQPDVILLARGGGSIEDLWAFNDERVARAIAASAAPVITGVGHETDFTIADFVCDLRAPTPTAAAELATPDRRDLLANLSDFRRRLGQAAQSYLSELRWTLNRQQNRLLMRSPQSRVRGDRQHVDELSRRSDAALAHRLRLSRERLQGQSRRLEALNPLAVLRRGYAVVTKRDGEIIRRTSQVAPGEQLDVRISDGSFGAQVLPDRPSKESNLS